MATKTYSICYESYAKVVDHLSSISGGLFRMESELSDGARTLSGKSVRVKGVNILTLFYLFKSIHCGILRVHFVQD